MKVARSLSLLLASLLAASSFAASTLQPETEKRIDALIRQMTLEEKLGQLQMLDGDADGSYRAEHPELIRRGLLGSMLNVRGAKRTRELQRSLEEVGALSEIASQNCEAAGMSAKLSLAASERE